MKKKYIIYLLLFAAIVLLSFVRYNELKSPRDTIRGTFQNDISNSSLLVQLTFESDNNSFFLYHDDVLVDEGSYGKADNNIYTLQSDLQDTYIILQDNNEFSYYDIILPVSKIVEMKLTLDAPVYIEQTYYDESTDE